MSRSSEPDPGDPRPKPVRAGLSPRPPCGVPSGGFVAEPLPGFTPTRRRFPFGVRIGLPLCVGRTLPLATFIRKRIRSFVFALTTSFRERRPRMTDGRIRTLGRHLLNAQNPEEARPKSRPLGVCSEATMSLQSGSWQSPTSSRGVPSLLRPKPRSIRNCSLSPGAETPIDPELSHLSRAEALSIRDRISGPKLLNAFPCGTEAPSRLEIRPRAYLR